MKKYAILSLLTLYLFLAFGGTCCFANDLDVFGPGGEKDEVIVEPVSDTEDNGIVQYYTDNSAVTEFSGSGITVISIAGDNSGNINIGDNTEDTNDVAEDQKLWQSRGMCNVEGFASYIMISNPADYMINVKVEIGATVLGVDIGPKQSKPLVPWDWTGYQCPTITVQAPPWVATLEMYPFMECGVGF